MNNERPYIEYNGMKYEFSASFNIKRIYDKEVKREYQEHFRKHIKTKKELDDIQELMEYIKTKQDNGEEVNEDNIDDNFKKKLLMYQSLILGISLTKVYENMCYLMLKEKYSISEEQFQDMLEKLADDYGIEFIDTFVQKVCEKVFMPKEEKKEKKALPSWMD